MSTYSGGYAGKISLTDATVESDNTVYADLAMMVGPDNIAATASEMGITSPIGDNPSIALGGLTTGVSPLEMANAYATLATGGQRLSGSWLDDGQPAPISIRRVTDDQGHTLARNSLVRSRVLETWQAGLETSVLQQVIARGTGYAAAIGRPAAGKTGTTTNYADAWFCGYTPDLSAAVWVGYPALAERDRRARHQGGRRHLPGQIWGRFAGAALTGVPAHAFPAFTTPGTVKRIVCPRTGDLATRWCPERIACFYFVGQAPTQPCTFHGPRPVLVPNVSGLSVTAARAALDRLQLVTQVVEVPGDPAAQGTVLGQSPGSGRTVLQGSTVTLQVDSGPLLVVPDVLGQYRGAALQALSADGFTATVSWDGSTRRLGAARHGRARRPRRRQLEPGRRHDRRARQRHDRRRARRRRTLRDRRPGGAGRGGAGRGGLDGRRRRHGRLAVAGRRRAPRDRRPRGARAQPTGLAIAVRVPPSA